MEKNELSRRNFLKYAGLTGATVGLAACRPQTTAPTATIAQVTESEPELDIDAEHEAVTKVFLDRIGKDDTFWGTTLPFTMDGDTKVFELKCQEVVWEMSPGNTLQAMTYNGIIPGPIIRVTEGDKVRVNVTNEMSQSTSVHFHGVRVPNSMDGVPFITQKPIKKGETFPYEFVATNKGTHMYHSHHNAVEQVTKGMTGAFIIEPKDKTTDPEFDSEYVLVLNDAGVGFSLNGKSFPYTQPIVAKLGEKVRIRYMNEGLQIHPMHLHGLEQVVFAKDGWNLPQPYMCDTLNVAPGERYDVIVDCHTAGAWAFHCHILSHAEGPRGMFGMVTAVVVQ